MEAPVRGQLSPAAIQTVGITRAYAQDAGVWDLDLHVPRQSIYGFLGPNGAGKTTTIRLLLGLLRPQSGRILVDGKAVEPGTNTRLWIGSLVEGPSLYPHLSGAENLTIAAGLLGLRKRDVQAVLHKVGLTDASRHLVRHYSLGMRQRLGIALALLGDPAHLILDEPSNGLDPAGMADLRRLLGDLVREEGKTVFLSSHQLDDVERIATHIGLLMRGRLVAEGEAGTLRRQHLVLRCDAAERSLGMIDQAGYAARRRDGDTLLIDAPPDAAAAINRMLVMAGVGVHELAVVRRSLADLFDEMTTPIAEPACAA